MYCFQRKISDKELVLMAFVKITLLWQSQRMLIQFSREKTIGNNVWLLNSLPGYKLCSRSRLVGPLWNNSQYDQSYLCVLSMRIDQKLLRKHGCSSEV